MDDEKIAPVTVIGRCSMCQNRAVLVDQACEHCRKRHGDRCGCIAHEIRNNPSFALYARDLIKKEYGEEVLAGFEHLFGGFPKIKIVE